MENVMLCKLMDSSYSGAAQMLFAAATQLSEAAEAARRGEKNLALGTAVGAEVDLKRAADLIAAVVALGQLGRA